MITRGDSIVNFFVLFSLSANNVDEIDTLISHVLHLLFIVPKVEKRAKYIIPPP